MPSHKPKPASMTPFCPVTDFDTTKALTCSATSSTVAKRPNLFVLRATSSRSAGKDRPHSYIMVRLHPLSTKRHSRTVSNMPGEMVFTLIDGAAVLARHLPRWIWAAFVTAYGYRAIVSKRELFLGSEEHTKLLPLGITPAKLAVDTKTGTPASRSLLSSRYRLAA